MPARQPIIMMAVAQRRGGARRQSKGSALKDNRFVAIFIRIVTDLMRRDLQGMAAQIAYRLIFALMPMLIFLTAFAGLVAQRIGIDNSMDHVTVWLQEHASPEIANVLVAPISDALNTTPENLLTFGGLLTIWSARGAIAAMINGLNLAYDVDDRRSWFHRQALSIALTIGLAVSVVVASVLNLLGSDGGQKVADLFDLGATWHNVSAALQQPVTIAVVIVLVALLHFLGPDVHYGFRWLLPGALLTVVCWVAAIFALRIYFSLAGGFAEAYGVFGGMLAVIFWIYVMGYILLLGGTVNAAIHGVLRPRQEPAAAEHRTDEPQTAPA